MYSRVCAVFSDPAALGSLDSEGVRFVQHTHRDGRRLGLHLEEGARAKVEALQTRISKLCTCVFINRGDRVHVHANVNELRFQKVY